MAFSVVSSFLLLLLLQLHLAISERAELVDSDGDEYGDTLQAAEPTLADEIRWVKLWNKHHAHVVYEATLHDAQDMVTTLGLKNSQHNSLDCEAGHGPIHPTGIMYEEENYSSKSLKDEVHSRYLKELDVANYPGYAIGLLTSKNCSAFLIGPYHALTLAECVYNLTTKQWITEMDLWIARNCSTYSDRMRWKSVTIPRRYFAEANTSYNWAYIEFDKSSPSKNWIGLSYDHMLSQISPPVTLNGYCNEKPFGCPYSTVCIMVDIPETNVTDNDTDHLTGHLTNHNLLVNCGVTSIVSFLGGPVIAAPRSPNSATLTSTPRLYGISSKCLQSSLHEVIKITEEMFWLLYTWMDKSGHTPACNIRTNRFIINRVIFE